MQTPRSKSEYTTNGGKQPASRPSSDFVLSPPHKTNGTHKGKNIKIIQRQTPQCRVNERCSSNLSDLEACFTQLQEELKKTKHRASSSELQKRQARMEVEEGKREMSDISAKFKEMNEQSSVISSSEDDWLQELCKISKERDRAWALELEALRKHHSFDSAALTSAKVEIQQLKRQLEVVTESELFQTKRAENSEVEVQMLQSEIKATLTLIERFIAEARNCTESEVRPQEVISETQSMIETVSSSTSVSHEVAESLVLPSLKMKQLENCTEHEEYIKKLKKVIKSLKSQVIELRAALDAPEKRYREEYMQSTLQVRNANELVDVSESESRIRGAELKTELKRVKHGMEMLQATQKNENEKVSLYCTESVWAVELKKARASLTVTMETLLEKGYRMKAIEDENDKMKLETQKAETEKARAVKHATDLADAGKVLESKVLYLTQEACQNSRRVAHLMKQLEGAQAANAEMRMELGRQKVQCDQWRKAAETAAAMLNTDRGKSLHKSESTDSSYLIIGNHLGPTYSDDEDDDTSKKKNGIRRQKMGVLWKKTNSIKQT